jgi:hypothetical protein
MGFFEFPSSDEILIAAKMAKAAYAGGDTNVGGGWQPLTGADLHFNGTGLFKTSYDSIYFNTIGIGGAIASAVVFKHGSELSISFTGTDQKPEDFLTYPGLNPTLFPSYLFFYAPFLDLVTTYAHDNNYTVTIVTGHSLGAAAANLLRDISDPLWNSADFITFATPVVASNSVILNIGFENDAVFEALAGVHLLDHPSTTDNLIWYNDAYKAGLPLGLSAHDSSNYINAVERIAKSEFVDEMNRDSTVVLVATDQQVTAGFTIKLALGSAYYLGRDHGPDFQIAGIPDDIQGGDRADTIEGFAGNDTLDGFNGDDRILGGEGDDIIYGGPEAFDPLFPDLLSDADMLDGGPGKDSIWGGYGNDIIKGGADDDSLVGERGNDNIEGEGGINSLWGGDGDDKLTAGPNGDQLIGGDGTDNLIGGAGADHLWGEGDDDIIGGGAGDDYLDGGDGVDNLRGGIGNDCLVSSGDGSQDILVGGPGADSFRVDRFVDIIMDFNPGEDCRVDAFGMPF